MRPDFDNPNFWKSLYKRPADSNTQGVVASSTELEEGDLEAELDPYAVVEDESATVDQEAVMRIVVSVVEARIKALMDKGWGPNAGPAHAAPASPAPVARRKAAAKAGPAPFQDPPRKQAAAAPFQDPKPAPRPAAAQAPPRPRPAPTAAKQKAGPKVGAAMWERIPLLPGGQASLFKAADLGPEAIQLLVLVDGSTNLAGLRQLVPQLDDPTFLGIIRAGIRQGILELT